jgi:hypothetical protein
MADMLSTAELASMKAEGLRAMPDTATILRPTVVNGPGGAAPTFPSTGPTTVCRLSASVLSGGSEQLGAGTLVSTMAYTLTVPPGTDIQRQDRIEVGVDTFEVLAIKGAASWNMSDSATMMKID